MGIGFDWARSKLSTTLYGRQSPSTIANPAEVMSEPHSRGFGDGTEGTSGNRTDQTSTVSERYCPLLRNRGSGCSREVGVNDAVFALGEDGE